jgi:sugar O-acyltransferase (sialic acid O-acetyltransferase NeuD family)
MLGMEQPDPPALRIAIYGGGGLAREVLQLVKDLAASGTLIDCPGFLVDPEFRRSNAVSGLPFLGDGSWLRKRDTVLVTIAIGSPAARRRIAENIERDFAARFVTLIHPRATIGDSVSIGLGSTVSAGSVAIADIQLGVHVQLHVNSTIGHDAKIGSFATVAPGANIGGATEIGEGAFVGSGAVVLPGCKIGEWSIVGAGSVITEDVPDNSTVVGVPARVIAQRTPGWHLSSDRVGVERLY